MDLIHAQKANVVPGKQSLTLVFVETKRGADALENWLYTNGFPATSTHGDRTQQEREYALRSFKSGATPILVATDVAPGDLTYQMLPTSSNLTYQMTLMTMFTALGEPGELGSLAAAFFSEGNMSTARSLCELMQEANQEVP